ncbi:uncharacterized protein EI90DRAFT_1412265 [Cantharellus anzutake]|uniref:uncharacterized protein n=1 Tax=Cantharellus anzutake TaxID=1750568 RepID=UPI00190785C6|nr:uncharacterized protein EI90DRAFT_1412265 [Cantharellus anzutake]KAF8329566.1 hypothetical protein EI90DRAFT_1412265 [Cantharellus anzutake]
MPQGYFVSNRKDKSRKAKEVPPPVQQIAFNHPSPSPTSSHVPSSGIPTSVPLLSPIQTSAHQHPHHRPQLSVSVPTTPHDSAGAGYPRFGQEPYATSSYRDIPGPHAHRSGGGCGDESSSDIYSSSPSPSPGLSPASSGLSQDDRHDEPALIPNGGALHPSTAHHQNGIQHYYPGALPLSRNSVILPSIASLRVRITRGEQVLIDEVEGSARLGEDEKQLQKLNPTLSQLF